MSKWLTGFGAALVGVCLVVLGLAIGRDGGAESTDGDTRVCDRENAEAVSGGPPVKPRVVLQPDANSQVRVINFGNDRDPETPSFRVKSEPPLPPDLEKRLSLTSDTFARTGNETAESVTFVEPKVSKLDVSDNRERIDFTVCLTPPADLPAGQYTGLVTLEGPTGVEGTTVTITANAKDERLFVVGIVATLLLAFGILLYKGAGDRRSANEKAAEGKPDKERMEAGRWGPAFGQTIKDPGWFFPTVFAVFATAGTLYAVYDNDPTWGAYGLSSIAGLIGAGLAAVGAKTIFSPSK